jgi:hypothetical protein
LEVLACRCEVSRLTTAGRNGIGLTSANRVNVQAMESGRKDAAGDGFDGHGGIAIGEVDSGIGDVFAAAGIELCCQLLSGGRLRRCC